MNFISRIIKSINAMRERLKIERHEAMYGPHFNEECALKAVSKMENEDGSRGEHWSLEETTSIANQYGINLKGEKYNKYDWYVALNMIRSDYYRAVVTMTSSDHIKYFPEKILVQNAGIDPGVAALLQNANKGNMDPAALIQDLLLLPTKKKQLIWLDRTTTSSKLKKKQQVSTMKKWRSVKIFQINQKRKQKFLQ